MLGKKGLTSSEASRVANYIKELVKAIRVDVDNFPVITSSARRDGTIHELDTHESQRDWKPDLFKKARLYSLSAWLKEAIKEKESQIRTERYRELDLSTVEKLQISSEIPSKPETSFEDFFRTLGIKQQAEYLTQEALAAHVGKFIHGFDVVREKFENFKPTTFQQISPTETLTILNDLLYDKDKLYEEVEELISSHRNAEKILNYYRAQHKEWSALKEREYQTNLKKYYAETQDIALKNSTAISLAQAEFEIKKTNRLEELSTLKIEIPEDLQPILDEIYDRLDS